MCLQNVLQLKPQLVAYNIKISFCAKNTRKENFGGIFDLNIPGTMLHSGTALFDHVFSAPFKVGFI